MSNSQDTKIGIYVLHETNDELIDLPNIKDVYYGKSTLNLPPKYINSNTCDDIGNFSAKYSELTALYWIWKNEKIPEYILVVDANHLIAFDAEDLPDNYGNIYFDRLNEDVLNKLGYANLSEKSKLFESNVLLSTPWNLNNTNISDVREFFEKTYGLEVEDIDIVIDSIKSICPKYLPSAIQYFNGSSINYYNIFLMKKEIFVEYCQFLFNILPELDKKLNYSEESSKRERTLSHLATHLLSIFSSVKGAKDSPYLPRICIGSVSKNRVKIFATHHDDFIKLPTEIIENIRAAKQYSPPGSQMRGNDEGDNISDKSESFCELTTQYWVWKNISNLDYYGFCHYRRFINFGETFTPDVYANVYFDNYSEDLAKRMGYLRPDLVDEISKYDIILTDPWDLSKVSIPSVYKQYDLADELYIEDLDCAIQIIKEKYPDYYADAMEYLNGKLFYPCNMFIMKKHIFDEYCEWLFTILFELERRRDTSHYSHVSYRMIGHVGERLLGIFITHQQACDKKYQIAIRQRVCIGNMKKYELPKPKFEKNNVPIVFAANDNFAPYTASAIWSVVKQSKSENNYDIFVLETELSNHSKQLIESCIKDHDNFSIRFIDVSSYLANYELKPNYHISVETFYRLLAPELFENYEKIVYLDGDIIVKRDIYDLFETDIGNALIAGAPDPDFYAQYNGSRKEIKNYVDTELKIQDPYQYIQAGVLILNLNEMRKTFNKYELLELGNGKLYIYGDQDIINIACQNRIYHLDMHWNVMHSCKGGRLDIIKKFAPRDICDQYLSCRENPYIIHYAGFSKPWNDPTDDFADIYWEEIRNSPVYEIIMLRMIQKNIQIHPPEVIQEKKESKLSLINLFKRKK